MTDKKISKNYQILFFHKSYENVEKLSQHSHRTCERRVFDNSGIFFLISPQ